jgi:hypothetical protein
MPVATVILECLTGFVGIHTCDTEEPGSGLYISDLPGISTELIQAITNSEDETFVVTWEKIEKDTILSFRSQMLAKLNECLQINKMATVECLVCENADLLAVAYRYLLGKNLMIWALYNWENSRFSTVDKTAVEEIRDFFQVEYERELAAAVQGIDVVDSDCIVNENACIQQNGNISYRDSVM